MKMFFMMLFPLFLILPAHAQKNSNLGIDRAADWNEFSDLMKKAEEQDRKIGWSYLLSGLIVSAGATVGSQHATDTAAKLAYGVSASFGIGAAGYGALRLANGNDFTQFYYTLRNSKLSPEQRDELVRNYLQQEREKEKAKRITKMITHAVVGGLNFYSASQEKDESIKAFFQFLGTVNLAMALTYTF